MAWSTSNGNAAYTYVMGGASVAPASDSFKAALFGNGVTPVQSASVSVTEYAGAGSTWSTANEVSSANYTAGGTAVTPISWTQALGVVTFTSSGSPSWTNVTFSTYGALVYDVTNTHYTNLGIAWSSFGGQQMVTSGNFNVVWNASGIVTYTH